MSKSRLLVGVLGLRNSGKSHTWNTLFGRTVKTGKHNLHFGGNEYVKTYLISGSPEERKKAVKEILNGQTRRIILCSMQYVDDVRETLDYFSQNRFYMYLQWLNPARNRYDVESFDVLGLTSRILSARSLLSMRSGHKNAASRVRELRNFIYGWAKFHGLLLHH
jgi:hypothetical protein